MTEPEPPEPGSGAPSTTPESAAPTGHSSSGLFRPAAGGRRRRRGEAPPAAEHLTPGRMLDEFRLVEPLDEGGMGAVWIAEQTTLGNRRVALKVIREDRINEKAIQFFRREADTGSTVSHPGIVSIYASGEADGVPYIAQELIGDGHTLADWIADLRTQETALAEADYREIAEFAAEVAEAVEAAHAAGVIHRDLKPQNILVDPEGNPRVTDFGLAKKVGEESISGRLDLIGTYYYMSPEQAMAKAIGLDHRTDIFSLGVVFYEMLTQRRPFDGDTREEILEHIDRDDPPPPHKVKSRTPRDLSWICVKAMEKRRADRYPSMAEFAADLRRFLSNEPIVARDPGPIRRAQKWVRRHPTTSSVAVVVAVAFVAVLGLLAVISGKNTELETTNSALASTVRERDESNATLASTNQRLESTNATLAQTNEDLEASRAEAQAKSLEAQEAAAAATASARVAEDQTRAAEAALKSYSRLEDLTILQELETESDRLWPARPHLLEGMDKWLVEAKGLLERLSGHEEELGRLRAKAAKVTPEVLAEALARSPRLRDHQDATTLLVELEAQLAALPEDEAEPAEGTDEADETVGEPSPAQRREALVAQRAFLLALRSEIEDAARATVQWRFPDDKGKQWRHDNLAKLVEGARALAAPSTGLLASVEARRARAATIENATVGEHFDAWLEAIEEIASSEHYDGLELSDQVGLVPIGTDPDSGLWEFWHVESGDRPERDRETGRIVVTEGMGVVLVLIPGGTFWMGASPDPSSPNHDPEAQSDAGPVHEVTLEPYLLSKYELTQGQWFRLTGERPSQYAAGRNVGGNAILDSNPVTNVSWEDGQRVLPRFGLRLPTEAQWECACRAGSATPCWCGSRADIGATEGMAGNLFDEGSLQRNPETVSWGAFESWDDGHTVHAPVGTYRANRFGLYDVLGNVWEWCEDAYVPSAYQLPVDATDGHRRLLGNRADGTGYRVARGGGFYDGAAGARSASRGNISPSDRNFNLGIRPAQGVTPD